MDDNMDQSVLSSLKDLENNSYDNNMRLQQNIEYFYSVLENVVSIAHLFLWVAIVLASSIFVYSIYKFKRLQTRTNYILLHYFISSTLASLCCALMLFLNMMSIRHHFIDNFLFGTGLAFFGATLIFVFLLAQDWILSVSNTTVARKYQTYYKWMIGSVYLFIALDARFDFIFSDDFISSPTIISGMLYVVSGIGIIVINIIRCRKQVSDESKQILYALKVANFYFLVLIPIFIFFLNIFSNADRLIRLYPILNAIVSCIWYFLELMAFSAPVIIIYLLPKWYEDFKIAYESIFRKPINGDLTVIDVNNV